MRAVLSLEAVTTSLLSWLNSAALIVSVCPDSVTNATPVFASHTCAVPVFALKADTVGSADSAMVSKRLPSELHLASPAFGRDVIAPPVLAFHRFVVLSPQDSLTTAPPSGLKPAKTSPV